jgi:serine/threonine protein kinase/Flp pilus assembly protein TadD
MGVVLKALDPRLNRVVAVKLLAPALATSPQARRRFLREARAAAAVCHEHVVTIHAVDEVAGAPYLVMQYVAGRSLQQKIDRDGPLDLEVVLRIGMQVAAGLAAAHAQGLVHRDIKPANILLENGVERARITDFGLARAATDASQTQLGTVAGTPQYMAPEQARGEPVDHRTDLYSLGGVLFAMVTGRPPFEGGSTAAVLRRVGDEPHPPVAMLNPAVPPWLVALIDRLLAKDPAARYQSAAEVADLLAARLAELQRPGSLKPEPNNRLEDAPVRSTGRGRRNVLLAGAVGLLALASLALLLLLWNSRPLARPGAGVAGGPSSEPTPDSQAWTYFHRGVAHNARKDWDRAIADFRTFLDRIPDFAPAYSNRAVSYENRGDLALALADMDTTLRLLPNNTASYVYRAWLRAGVADYEGAVADYTQALRHDPDDPVKWCGRACALALAGRYVEAEADFEAALQRTEDYPWPLARRARYLHMRRGDHDRAIADCDRILEVDGTMVEAVFHRGLAYLAKGEPGRAVEDFDRVLSLDQPDAMTFQGRLETRYPKLYAARGDARARLGDAPGAKADRDQAERLRSTPRGMPRRN